MLRWGLVVLALLVPLSAHAAPKVAIVPFRGKGGPACSERLEELLFAKVPVAEWRDGESGIEVRTYEELLEFLRANKAAVGADVVVLGTVSLKKLILEAYDVSKGSLLGLTKVSVNLTKGCHYAPKAEARLVEWIAALSPEKKGAPSPPPPRVNTSTISVPPPPPDEPPPPTEPPPSKIETPLPIPPSQARIEPYTLAIEADLGVESRSLSFGDPESTRLRAFSGTFGIPGFRVEARPFGHRRYLEGLLLSLAYRQAIGLSAERIEGGERRSVKHAEAAAQARYRFLIPSTKFSLVPALGAHAYRLTLGDGGDPDLPGVSYFSLTVGANLEVPVTERAVLVAGGNYHFVTSSGAIATASFLGPGSTRGLSIEGGLLIGVLEGVSILTAVRLLTYAFDADGAVEAERPAGSAADTSVSVRAGVRFEL